MGQVVWEMHRGGVWGGEGCRGWPREEWRMFLKKGGGLWGG
ncbi:hypothetical protein [Bartonella sp. AU18XJBT]|nr:hypothetical protein [Bartonella sp. AU18XJBT]